MRSFVADPMQHGRLYLAGDAAHIVPPTGAKGLNLAVNDVRLLGAALRAHYDGRPTPGSTPTATRALRRVWRAQDFSNYMTQLLHDLGGGPFQRRLQLSRLEYVERSEAAAHEPGRELRRPAGRGRFLGRMLSTADAIERARGLAARGRADDPRDRRAARAAASRRSRARSSPSSARRARLVGMDGFHLAQAELVRLGRRDRMGAPDTFDAAGYVALLRRLRDDEDASSTRPSSGARSRSRSAAIAVPRDVPLVVTEGNYLLRRLRPGRRSAPARRGVVRRCRTRSGGSSG